jgi:hypothetical protein
MKTRKITLSIFDLAEGAVYPSLSVHFYFRVIYIYNNILATAAAIRYHHKNKQIKLF